jgi:hypothetical protein
MADKHFQTEINNFRTLNPNDHPRNIADDEMSLCVGFMPVGRALKTVPSNVLTLEASTDPDLDINAMFEGNFSGARYRLVALSDGSLIRYSTAWAGRTVVAAAGSFTSPAFAQWKNSHVLIIDPTKGYFSFDGTTLSARISTYVGTSIAVFKQRAFIADGLVITFSDPNNFSGFAAGGGSISDNYPSIGLAIIKLVAIQDYLYIIGQRGTHIIHGIQILDDASTIFTISDALPNIGTNHSNTICVHGNTLFLLDTKGLVAIEGTSFTVFSGPIAGLLSVISNLGTASCFHVTLYGKVVFCFTAALTSPVSGLQEQWFMCLTEGRWFCVKIGNGSLYSIALTVQDIDFGGYNAYLARYNGGSGNGNDINQAFGGTGSVLKKVRTKAFSFGATTKDKTVSKVGAIATAAGLAPTLRVISDISGSATLLTPDNAPDSGDYLYAREIDARGKSMAIDFEETSATQYTLSGFIVEGTVGADW